jgi:DNA-binding PucR family transcriptional regulator
VIYDEVVPLALVLDAPPEERSAFIDAQLGRVLGDPLGEDLVASLRAFYAAGQSVAAAARTLHVHRHTLEYRLGRLEALLGRDIRANEPRLLLELALSLRAAQGTPG